MSKLSDVILRDTDANRPAASIAGRLFWNTTFSKMQRDTGSAWEDVGRSVPVVVKTRTSSNLVLNSATWANVDTGMDITLAAATGDTIEVSFCGVYFTEAVFAFIDVATIVSGSPVNYFACAGGASDEGIKAWTGQNGTPSFPGVGGTYMRTLVSGDISSGTVLLRLRYRTSSASNKTLIAGTTAPLQFTAKNLGQ